MLSIFSLYSCIPHGQGDVKLEEKTAYKSATDDELIMLEMSKREKKKFQKQKYSK